MTPATAPALVIRNARIIDGSGALPTAPRDIFLSEGRIARITRAGEYPAAPDAREIDAAAAWVIPGLIDLHIHRSTGDETLAQVAVGVTTVRETGAATASTAADRDAVDAGIVEGPRIVVGGFQYGAGYGITGETEQMVTDSAAAARSLSIAQALGAQYVKHRPLSGWYVSAMVVDEAHRRGLRVSGHCTHPLPLAAAGIDGREHNNAQCFLRDGPVMFADMNELTRATGTWVVPTVAFYTWALTADSAYLKRADVAPYLTPAQRGANQFNFDASTRASFERFNAVSRQNTIAQYRKGVLIGTGSDAGLPHRLHWEIEGLVRAGLTPLEAIRAATLDAARILGAEQQIGSIELGKLADLVILDADPTVDIRNTQRVREVIKGGRVVKR